MAAIPVYLPTVLPSPDYTSASNPPLPGSDPFSLYDVAIGGVGFELASDVDHPMVRETQPLEKQRVDQEQSAGEQTLTGWWIRSQDSFHGGAGQLQLEPAVPTPVTHVRFDLCKNIDPFVPGRATRLPDTTVISTDVPTAVVGVVLAGADALVTLVGGQAKLITGVTGGTRTTATFTGVSGGVGLATDGTAVYVSTLTTVYRLDPSATTATPVTLATFTTAATSILGWVKSRLMLGAGRTVYEVDVTLTGVTLGAGETRYVHPATGFTWRAFANGPQALLAAGDAGGLSTITAFNVQAVSGAPVITVAGDIGELPLGERILSLASAQGSFLAIGTTSGVRVGTYDAYYGRLSYGPLQLTPDLPVIPARALLARDRFVYSVGSDFDEAGILAVDLGTRTDDSGRFAWAPHLTCPTLQQGVTATAGTTLPVTNRLTFVVPGVGILLEGVGSGTVREAWLRTSRIRFGTAEPKLFKMGRIRGDLSSGEVAVSGSTPDDTEKLATVGFTTVDPDEFRLPSAQTEWLQLTLNLIGSASHLTSYSVKALPGTRRQRFLQLSLAMYDSETTKTGQRVRQLLHARDRLDQLEELDARGDEVKLEEFTPSGVVSTVVVIEKVSFSQVGRPGRRSDLGGTITVTLRTVES